jgi:hypothetical protein
MRAREVEEAHASVPTHTAPGSHRRAGTPRSDGSAVSERSATASHDPRIEVTPMPITVVNPTSQGDPDALRLAPALPSLEGCLLGLLDNGKANSDRLLGRIADILRERHGVRELMRRQKPDFSRPAPAELLRELSACDAIITAIGD